MVGDGFAGWPGIAGVGRKKSALSEVCGAGRLWASRCVKSGEVCTPLSTGPTCYLHLSIGFFTTGWGAFRDRPGAGLCGGSGGG